MWLFIRKQSNSLVMKKQNKSPGEKSRGTIVVAEARARANSYSDAKRADLMERGMALIYGPSGDVKASRHRSGFFTRLGRRT